MGTDPSSSSSIKYDVFLSFRGDTRYNFTSHLDSALRKSGLFSTFKDENELYKGKDKLQKGKDIEKQLMKAIENSRYAIVVLSEKYADSDWCLKELAKIVKCMGDSGKILTIVYHVNLSHVRNVNSNIEKEQQESSFWKALEVHAKNPSHSRYVESWRNALVKVTYLHKDYVGAHTDEANFIEAFVADISSKIGASIRTIEGLFEMIPRQLEFESFVLQSSDADNVCFIGIHGMGGIGKSTLIQSYYMKMSSTYDGSSFLHVREVCNKEANGLEVLQKKLLKDILEEDLRVDNFQEGINIIKGRLWNKKVLIILDDVNNQKQLEALADKWFAPKSVIIVTTRNADLLGERYKIYKAQLLDNDEALQLFSWKAFENSEPPTKFKEHSKEVVKYASNLPLALIELGYCFKGIKDESIWKPEWEGVRTSMKDEIFEKLKISFDELDNVHRPRFLDIACFFSGLDEDYVLSIMDKYGSSIMDAYRSQPIMRTRKVLIEKSLLMSTQHDGKLQMHYLLQEMGKKIVRQESGNHLQKQSRIWDADDLRLILENHEEEWNQVDAIVTNLEGSNMKSKFEALPYMRKLRILMIKYLSNEFQSSFQPRERLWFNGIKPLIYLKVVDLSFSLSFTKLEGFTVVPNLEALILEECKKLLEIDPSIKQLRKLILLNLKFCESLENLPEGINGLPALQTLKLSGCRKLKDLPDNLEQLKSLRDLELNDSGIKHLPSSMFLMKNLKSVSCDEEMIKSAIRENITSRPTTGNCFIPDSFCTFLTKLELSHCMLTGPVAFPEYFGKLFSLRYLDLSNNPLSVLPPEISGLSRLKSLSLEHCKRLERLEPELLPSSLEVVNINYCTSLGSFLDPLKPCHLKCSSVFCLDCTELVKRQDGKMTALASLSRFLENPSVRRDKDFKFVVPHSDYELPSWFINTSLTAAINIKLDPSLCNSELIGFAMVFCFGANTSKEDNFSCRIRVRGSENWKTIMEVGVIKSRMSDHLCLLYSPCEDTLEFIQQLDPQSLGTLEFSFLGASDKHGSSCGPCGVRLISEKDIEELKILTSISQHSKLRPVGPIRRQHSTGLREILDVDDNSESVEMQRYAHKDGPNPESNPSMLESTHFGVFRNYSPITTKLDKTRYNIVTPSISQHSKLRLVGPIRRQHSTGLRGSLDEDDKWV